MKKKKIKPCLTKQLLNMFKLWCEWGIRELDLITLNHPDLERYLCVNNSYSLTLVLPPCAIFCLCTGVKSPFNIEYFPFIQPFVPCSTTTLKPMIRNS